MRLIASVPIIPRTVKFGLSCRGMKTSRQMATPASAPLRIPDASTTAG